MIFPLIFCGCQQASTKGETEFYALTDNWAKEQLANDPLSCHYLMKNASAANIVPKRNGFYFSIKDQKTQADALLSLKKELKQFNTKQFSAQAKLDARIFSSYLDEQAALHKYAPFKEVLSPTQGENSRLPVLLCEYRLENESDVSSYFELLKSIPDYFKQLMEWERYKAEKGTFMNDAALEKTVMQCRGFSRTGDENLLITSFNERTASLPKNSVLQEKNKELVQNIVLPAYEWLAGELESMSSSCTSPIGLCQLPQGKEYYEQLIRSYTGSSTPVSKLKSTIAANLQTYIRSALSLKSGTASSPESKQNVNADLLLNHLKLASAEDFPIAQNIDCTIKYVNKSMEEHLSPAFYLIPPMDDYKENVIYLNPLYTPSESVISSESEMISLFSTLAHEGYPGHLLQTTSYYDTSPALFRHLLPYDGYTEGWATYCEYYAYKYLGTLGLSGYKMQLSLLNSKYSLALSCLSDILVNYDGYSKEQLTDFLKEYGITSSKSCNSLFEYVTTEPGVYLKYYIGCLEFESLKNKAKAQNEDFDLLDFHKKILACGPCSFDILSETILSAPSSSRTLTYGTAFLPFFSDSDKCLPVPVFPDTGYPPLFADQAVH